MIEGLARLHYSRPSKVYTFLQLGDAWKAVFQMFSRVLLKVIAGHFSIKKFSIHSLWAR